MRRALAAVAAAAIVFSVSATAAGTSRDGARLRLVGGTPLALGGAGFAARERVRVTATAGAQRASRRVVAGARGRFRVTFPAVAFDRCVGLDATAVGNRGSRAQLKLPQPLCPPRP